jgi:Kdo2-lipid IVA lauroyltransferase/acyltransferase
MFTKIADWLLLTFLRGLSATFQRVSLRTALGLGAFIGILAYYLYPSRQRIALQNLQLAFGTKLTHAQRKDIIYRLSKNLGRYAIEFLRFPKLNSANIDDYVTITGLENLQEALKAKRGALILTAHFGNWDLFAVTLALKGYPTNLLTKYLSVSAINTFWLESRKNTGIKQLYREGSLKEIIRCLKNNEIIGFVLDQNTRRDEGIFIKFFGIDACTIPALAVLAQRLNSPVVPAFIVRQKDGRHKAIMDKPLIFESKATLEESIAYNTQLYTNVLEKYIRLYPDHWTWIHHRWKTRPIGQPPIYK